MRRIIVDDKGIVQTSCACPTQFEFNDIGGNAYFFRLRFGGWRLDVRDGFGGEAVTLCSGLIS